MTATVTRISSRREVYVHLDLDEPADVDMLPMPIRLDPDVNPDPVVRALVVLRTLDGIPEQPILTLSTGRGRHITAGAGQNPAERDDSLLQRFAHLIDAARERVAYLDTPKPAFSFDKLVDGMFPGTKPNQGGVQVNCFEQDRIDAERLATVRHLGDTDTPALHVCRHQDTRDGHVCNCTSPASHTVDQPGSACPLDEHAKREHPDVIAWQQSADGNDTRDADA